MLKSDLRLVVFRGLPLDRWPSTSRIGRKRSGDDGAGRGASKLSDMGVYVKKLRGGRSDNSVRQREKSFGDFGDLLVKVEEVRRDCDGSQGSIPRSLT